MTKEELSEHKAKERLRILALMKDIKPITKQDLASGTGDVVKVDARSILVPKFEQDSKNKTFVVNFGKYKGSSIHEIKKKDKGYFNWMCENNDFFYKKAKEFGLDQEYMDLD